MASQLSRRFEVLQGWLSSRKLRQSDLVERLNAVPGRFGKLRTKSEINRLLNGRLRFVDPWLGSELSHVTNGEIDGLTLLTFVAECVALRADEAA